MIPRRGAVALVLAVAVAPVRAQDPPNRPTPPASPPPTVIVRPAGANPAANANTPPVLPVDAKRLVDQTTVELIRQLKILQDAYMANNRPDDAAAVRTQITLLQRATGITDDGPTRADSGPMSTYRDRVGQTFNFTITGSADHIVWGTSIYTDDTPIEAAAVHAGVLRSGQTGPVRVTVLPGQGAYQGSKRNGIESGTFGPYGGSYRIEIGNGLATRPTSIASFRGRVGEVLTVPVVGVAAGAVWGVDVYTDDSSLGAAAVHAGVVQPGEFAFVRVTMLGGLASYPGGARNGVTSQTYGEWEGSFRVERAPQPWVLRLPADVEDGTGMVTLAALRNKTGVSFSLRVTGASGTVRGSDVYTDDSSIAAAAVHAGVLRPGERGYVRVTVLPGQQEYMGSEQNGLRSTNAGVWGGSFRVERGSGG